MTMRSLQRTVLVTVIGFLAVLFGPALQPQRALAAPATYYVDCEGNDGNSGTTPEQAWRSVDRANRAELQPGDSLLFKRGCRWDTPTQLEADWRGTAAAPIVIGAYGDGTRPMIVNTGSADRRGGVIEVSGEYLIVEHFEVTANPPSGTTGPRCTDQSTGWTTGFEVSGQFNTVRYGLAYGMTAGVHLTGGDAYASILHNELINNRVMSQNTPDNGDNDSGAWGVLINSNYNLVAYNYMSGNVACSEDYGIEGASLEVYRGSHNIFFANRSINDTTFTELGGDSNLGEAGWARNNVYMYNLYATANGDGHLLVLNGRDSKWGANPGTRFFNNTAYNVKIGISCSNGCNSEILEARNNIVVSSAATDRSALYASGPFAESNNIFWRVGGGGNRPVPLVNIGGSSAMDGSSRIADPQFVDAAANDFRLQSSSPAIDAGSGAVLSDYANIVTSDVLGMRIPVGAGVDIGAVEHGTSEQSTTVPTPSAPREAGPHRAFLPFIGR